MARLTIADLEIERNEDPFEIELEDGEVFTLRDPKSIPAATLVVLEKLSPRDQLKAAIADDRGGDFLAREEVDGYFLEALMNKYAAFYGLGDLGKGRGSGRSSSGTAKR